MNQHHQLPNRRQFVRHSAAMAAGAALAPMFLVGRFAHAAGSDQIRVGLIGAGGRGSGATANALQAKAGGVKLVAMADLFERRLATSHKFLLSQQYADKVDVPPERQFLGFDAYQRVLQCGVDMVIIASASVFHPLHYRAAVDASKHVFLEWPCCIDGPGFRLVEQTSRLAEMKQLAVVVGHQSRYSLRLQEEVRRLKEGAIGKIELLEASRRHGPIGSVARNEGETDVQWQLRNSTCFAWVGGEPIVGWMSDLLDICNWIQGDHPVRAVGIGGRRERFAPDAGDILDHFEIDYTYADGARLRAEFCATKGGHHRFGNAAVGSKGTWAFVAPSGSNSGFPGRTSWEYRGPPFNMYQLEMDALVDAIRQGQPHNEGMRGAVAAMTGVLGRMAAYEGREVTWDEAIACRETYLPESLTWDSPAPAQRDKFGNFPVPYRAPIRGA